MLLLSNGNTHEPSAEAKPEQDVHASVGSSAHDAPAGPGEVETDPDAVHEDTQDIVTMMDETLSQPSPTMPLIYDLNTVEAVSNPRDIFEERRALERRAPKGVQFDHIDLNSSQ